MIKLLKELFNSSTIEKGQKYINQIGRRVGQGAGFINYPVLDMVGKKVKFQGRTYDINLINHGKSVAFKTKRLKDEQMVRYDGKEYKILAGKLKSTPQGQYVWEYMMDNGHTVYDMYDIGNEKRAIRVIN